MSVAPVSAIVAMDEGRVIGKNGALPWHLPEDLLHFKARTSGHVVIMGRKTWDSLPEKFRPLPGRTNLVVSRSPDSLSLPASVLRAGSVEDAIRLARDVVGPEQKVWIIGGAEIYRAALPLCDEVHITLVRGHHDGDATFPAFEDAFEETSLVPGERCDFKVFVKK